MCLPVFFKLLCRVILSCPHQLKASPSNLMVFSAEQILIWRVDLHGFLCNAIYKPTEKKIKHSESRVHCVAWSLPAKAAVVHLRWPLHVVLTTVAGSAPWGVRVGGTRASGTLWSPDARRCVPKIREWHSSGSAVMWVCPNLGKKSDGPQPVPKGTGFPFCLCPCCCYVCSPVSVFGNSI